MNHAMFDGEFASEQEYLGDEENFQVDLHAHFDDVEDDLVDAFTTLIARIPISISTKQMDRSFTELKPTCVDDFIRNFMIKTGMRKSLDVFNTEWYELERNDKLHSWNLTVPDEYVQNSDLAKKVCELREEIEKNKGIVSQAAKLCEKLRNERNYHSLRHRQAVQEKEKLNDTVKRLRTHMRAYEPVIYDLQERLQKALKLKSLTKLERDNLLIQVKALEAQLAESDDTLKMQPTTVSPNRKMAMRSVRKQAVFPTEKPAENPYLHLDFDPAPFDNFQKGVPIVGHQKAVCCVAFHPTKNLFATGSDDFTWRLWSDAHSEVTELSISANQTNSHTEWMSALHFHPHGAHLTSSSGDGTVKVWEVANGKNVHTFSGHTRAVWGCEFHPAGDFVASCSMDHTVRIWDLIAGKCKQTLRGHVDSVNACCWQPFTANVCSASGDKTVSVWDGRSGLCAQTFHGHTKRVNDVKITHRGDTIVSADGDGVVKVWDVRMTSELASIRTCKSILLDRRCA